MQHFTSFRRRTFELYPTDQTLNFDVEEYVDLCTRTAPKADAYRRTKTAIAFGAEGRQRQRAYYDALRDLVLPLIGHPPILRIPALDGNGERAYLANRERIIAALGN